ncbi:MAG: response regulator [Thermodesulfobacteriota bacterium]
MAHTILIVDDSPPMRSVIRKTIKASGYGDSRFFEAGNGAEALQILRQNWLDLVVTDYNMPSMNGMELIAAMKKDEVLQAVPVLVITTEGSSRMVDEFLAGGAAGYLKKPFTPEEIRTKIIAVLGESHDEEDAGDGAEGCDF